MSKKYTSLEHTIRNIHSKQLNEFKIKIPKGPIVSPKIPGVKEPPIKQPTKPAPTKPIEPIKPAPAEPAPKPVEPTPKPVEPTPKPVEPTPTIPKPGEAPVPGTKPGEAPVPGTKPGEAPAPGPKPGEAPAPGPKPAEEPTPRPKEETPPADKSKGDKKTGKDEKTKGIGGGLIGFPSADIKLGSAQDVGNYGPGTSASSTSPIRKNRLWKENLEEMGIIGGKFKGIPNAFMEPNPVIRPKKSDEQQERTTQHAKFHSGKRKEAKMRTSSTMQGKVSEDIDRKEIEYVSRPDTAKSPKDKKSKLGRQSAVLSRIIDEEKTLLEFFNVTLKKKKEQKRKKVEAESGKTQVVFNPKLITPKE